MARPDDESRVQHQAPTLFDPAALRCSIGTAITRATLRPKQWIARSAILIASQARTSTTRFSQPGAPAATASETTFTATIRLNATANIAAAVLSAGIFARTP